MTDTSEPNGRSRRSGVQSIEIGGLLLDALVAIGQPATLTDIARRSDMPSAKAHRYLTSLCEIGLTVQHKDTGCYGLGPLALRMGLSAIAQQDVIELGFEVLTSLCDTLKTSGHLSVWSEAGPVVIRSAHGGPPVISPVAVGTILPLLRSASGLVYLAYMSEASTAPVVDRQHISGDPGAAEITKLKREVERDGYALAKGQYIPGLCAIALPIKNHDQSLAGAITLVSTDGSLFTGKSSATLTTLQAMDAFHRQWSIESETEIASI
ncbi:MAG: IclR family transcriptional regulator [Pseudomonadota bacterium]